MFEDFSNRLLRVIELLRGDSLMETAIQSVSKIE